MHQKSIMSLPHKSGIDFPAIFPLKVRVRVQMKLHKDTQRRYSLHYKGILQPLLLG